MTYFFVFFYEKPVAPIKKPYYSNNSKKVRLSSKSPECSKGDDKTKYKALFLMKLQEQVKDHWYHKDVCKRKMPPKPVQLGRKICNGN